MIHELTTERQALAEVLEREIKKVVRMVRSFPLANLERRFPDCSHSARELALQFAEHVRRIEELASGRVSEPARTGTRSRGEILMELELAYLGAHTALRAMPPFRWGQVIDAPAGLAPWRQARRGELLWFALRELVRHDRHFGQHLGEALNLEEGPAQDSTDARLRGVKPLFELVA